MKYFMKSLSLTTALLCTASTVVHANQQGTEVPKYDFTPIKGFVDKIEKKSGWRKKAYARIAKVRQGDLSVVVVDPQGNPMPNVKISMDHIQHNYSFGAAVNAGDFHKYKSFLPDFVDEIGFNNALKYKQKGRADLKAEKIIEWARSQNISVRGHTLIWPSFKFSHKKSHKLKNNPKKLKSFLDGQVVEYAKRFDVDEWDVVNETRVNHDFQDMFGKQVLLDWFALAQKNVRNKGAGLYLNENKVASAPKGHEKNVDHYYGEVKYLLDNGAPLTGLGLQSRFRTLNTKMSDVYKRLDKLAAFGLPIKATEFEITPSWTPPRSNKKPKFTPTEDERAMMTEKVMTTYFSHPSVEGFIAWNFMDRGRIQHGLIDEDGTIKKNGLMWLYLSQHVWDTKKQAQSDNNGQMNFNGYYGTYDVVITGPNGKMNTQLSFSTDNKLNKITYRK